ncbi:transcription factor MYBS3-like [Zingiber officinale]|uniref:transcription factor MYBS3-like n=1 Tax=Zingiber officinale TaxID=94328 RepID=UPI001C4C94B2|nr:transcription factor MYBS3-like [Zingiber officinale]
MTRRCSHCNHDGHNSRTCPNRGVKLFGVRLDGSVRKSASMGNLSLLAGSSGGASPADGPEPGGGSAGDGYASEDFVKGSSSSCRDRKKGTPWTEEEHRMFLLGLQKLGKGDWRGISRNFVVSRTPTQVASHAQKYFIRKSNMTRRKRRSSLFDMVPDEPLEPQLFPMSLQESELQSNKPPPIPPTLNEECESMDSNDSMLGETVVPIPEAPQSTYTMVLPTYYPPFLQFASPYWPGGTSETPDQAHEIIKPTAVHSKSPINVEELVGMSKLSIGDNGGETVSLSSSLGLLSGSKRQSAFHANPFPKART